MDSLAESDPFAPPDARARHTEDELEARWFAASRRARICATRPPPREKRLDDPVADAWFR